MQSLKIAIFRAALQCELQKIKFTDILNFMLEELKLPVEQLREEIMNVWGRL